jgi:Winged helix DNA-binding domain
VSDAAAGTATVLAERLTAQLLSGPPAGAVCDVVRRILAVQAQDPRGARLAIRARSAGLTAHDVDRALTIDRSVVVATVNRGTLHLVRAEDYWWLHPLTSPRLEAGLGYQLARQGLSRDAADRGVVVVERSLASDGPLTRGALRDRLASADVPTDGQAFGLILALAGLRGLVVRGPVTGGEQAIVSVRDWLGTSPPALPREQALGELARRYLAGHGPADERDLARWAGITLGDARRGLSGIASQLIGRDDGLAAIVDRTDRAELPPPRLLGPFDPSLHGWASREPILGTESDVVTTNGIFRPFAMVDGRAAARWTLERGAVSLTPYEPLPASVRRALEADGAAVVEFLGGPAGSAR